MHGLSGLSKLILLHRSQPKCPISVCLADFLVICACVHTKSLQLCPTPCDPVDCSPLGSSVHGILQARILEWVAMPFYRGSFVTQGSNPHLYVFFFFFSMSSVLASRFFTCSTSWEVLLGIYYLFIAILCINQIDN